MQVGKGDPNPLADGLYPLDHPLRRIVRRREHLALRQPPGLLVEDEYVGGSAADVDRNIVHVFLPSLGSFQLSAVSFLCWFESVSCWLCVNKGCVVITLRVTRSVFG